MNKLVIAMSMLGIFAISGASATFNPPGQGDPCANNPNHPHCAPGGGNGGYVQPMPVPYQGQEQSQQQNAVGIGVGVGVGGAGGSASVGDINNTNTNTATGGNAASSSNSSATGGTGYGGAATVGNVGGGAGGSATIQSGAAQGGAGGAGGAGGSATIQSGAAQGGAGGTSSATIQSGAAQGGAGGTSSAVVESGAAQGGEASATGGNVTFVNEAVVTPEETRSLSVSQETIDINSRQRIENVPPAMAPGLGATSPCMGSTSLGGSGVGFGFSAGTTWHDKDCTIRETARSFAGMGMNHDAMAILCSSDYASAAPSCTQFVEDQIAARAGGGVTGVSGERPSTGFRYAPQTGERLCAYDEILASRNDLMVCPR